VLSSQVGSCVGEAHEDEAVAGGDNGDGLADAIRRG
jgi:hypothetical protein